VQLRLLKRFQCQSEYTLKLDDRPSSAMAALTFRPRPWQIVVSGLVSLACLVGAAFLGGKGHETVGWILAHDAVQAVGASALALGGVGALLSLRAWIRWTPALQVIAVDLLDETLRHTGAIMSAAAYVVLDDWDVAREIDQAFQLPWGPDSESRAKETLTSAIGRSGEIVSSLDREVRAGDPAGTATSGVRAVLARVDEVAEEITTRTEKLRASAAGLGNYVSLDFAIPLSTQITWLSRHVRTLVDEGPGRGTPTVDAALRTPSAAAEVLQAGIAIGSDIQPPFDQILRKLKDETLRKELADREQTIKVALAFRHWKRANEAHRAEIDRTMAETQKVIDHMRETGNRLLQRSMTPTPQQRSASSPDCPSPK
jgi:hypothetical protein